MFSVITESPVRVAQHLSTHSVHIMTAPEEFSIYRNESDKREMVTSALGQTVTPISRNGPEIS